MRFQKILIANRGEIACRVIASAREQGYQTVAVYSEADADARHVQMADEAVCIGAPAVSESYLRGDKILEVAKATGAGAIHPGYGFLSENADFAKACEAADIVFIGPRADAIELMGSKRQSKLAMLAADVPCVPGYEGADQSDEVFVSEADKIGYPVMVKASAGGGGRGMRMVERAEDMLAALKSARSEALNAFGSDELILEKAVIHPRHIEIQVFADEMGNTVYLGERDCSMQRRHQKVVEEAPSPFVDEALRQTMGEAAVAAAKACQYRGAGTVEFLVDKDKRFYFLEMNTRLQVEHPVTEQVTGLDLVAMQFEVAQGLPLSVAQSDVQLNGHSIEVRLYAEDPGQDFMPQTGQVLRFEPCDDVRNDYGILEGQSVSAHYDPMIAKVIAYGSNRTQAINRLIRALANTRLSGLKHNSAFLQQLLDTEVFRTGEATTQYIEQSFLGDYDASADAAALASAAVLMYLESSVADESRRGWTSASATPWPLRLRYSEGGDEKTAELRIAEEANGYRVSYQDQSLLIDNLTLGEGELTCRIDGQDHHAWFDHVDSSLWLSNKRGCFYFENITHLRTAGQDDGAGDGRLQSKINGAVVALEAQAGQRVSKGDVLVVLEAMKMEHPYKAPRDGVIAEVLVEEGQQVKPKQVLVSFEEE